MNRTTEKAAADQSEKSTSRQPWQGFISTIQDDELQRYSGPGVTLDDAIEGEIATWLDCRRANAKDAGVTPEQHSDVSARTLGDVVIWSHDRVHAIVRSCVGGPPEVLRFTPAERFVSPRPVVEVGDRPPSDGQEA